MNLKFQVIQNSKRLPGEGNMTAYLHVDHWDDWFKYNTMYFMTVYDALGEEHKIGEFDQKEKRAKISKRFKKLPDGFFSLGQDAVFYTNIYQLEEKLREHILEALNDVVFKPEIFVRALDEGVTKVSLLRSVSPASVKGQFRRILRGGDRLTRYSFKYELPHGRRIAGFKMKFKVRPDSNTPTNIHVVIGRNGVGKTHLLNNMVRALVDDAARKSTVGELTSLGIDEMEDMFSGVVSLHDTSARIR